MPRPSGFIEPCQPLKVARPPSGPLWVHSVPTICSVGVLENLIQGLPPVKSMDREKSIPGQSRRFDPGRRSFSDFSREPNLPFLLLGLSYMRDLPPERADSPAKAA